ncbi:Uma2 family endonuclease [bacterium]|nr:MAG: Uma2 family endonuclease [bacterium]
MAVASPLAQAYVSPEEYLRREARSPEKSEYQNGRILAMSGGSFNHVQITTNLNTSMGVATRGKLCRYFASELKILISEGPRYFYPDGAIACPPNIVDSKNGIIDNPKVVFEVLSPGTEGRDRREKFFAYAGLASIEQIVFIGSEYKSVEVWSREGKAWRPEVSVEGSAFLTSVNLELSLEELYENVRIEEAFEE